MQGLPRARRHVRKCRTWLVVTALCCASEAVALNPEKDFSQYPRSHWSSEQGVLGDFVLAIARTPDGFVWVGTRSGLLRFDGVKFAVQVAAEADLLKHQRVESVHVDRQGQLWAGTDRTLIRMRGGAFEAAWPSPEPIHTLADARGGGIWVGTARGLFKFAQGERIAFAGEGDAAALSVRAVLEQEDGVVWIGADSGLYRLADGQVQALDGPDGPGKVSVRALLGEPDGSVWIGSNSPRVHRLRGATFESHVMVEGATTGSVSALAKDKDGNLWMGTSMGVARLTATGELRLFGLDQGLPDARVASLLRDDEDNLWLGTRSGLILVHDGDFASITQRQGLPSNSIRVVMASKAGTLWVGSEDKGLFTWDGKTATPVGAKDGLDAHDVRALHEDDDASLWVGTTEGLYRREGHTFSLVPAAGPKSRPEVGSIARARGGGIWVGTRDAGLFRGDARGLVRVELQPPPFGWLRPVYEDSSGRLWLATQDGRLMWRDGADRAVEEVVAGLRYPRAFYEQGDTLWVGFRGGLARRRNGAWSTWTSRDGLPATSMSQIIEDDAGGLWLGGALGILRVDQAALNAYLDGRGGAPAYRTYRRADGLQTTECSLQPGSARTRDGRLYFPTSGGLAAIDPNAPKVPAPAPRVHVSEMDIDGIAYVLSGPVVAPPGPGTLSLHYTAPTVREPRKLLFRYRLAGFDPDWVEGDDRRFARYNNVPPGSYRFIVEARHSEGLWPPQQAAVPLTLRPYFHQTRAFAFLVAALLLVMLYLAWRLRHATLRRRHELVAQERLRIARDFHDNLDQSLFAATLQLDLATKLLPQPERATSHISLARNLLSHFQEEARRSIADLRAQDLDAARGSLQEALSQALPRLVPESNVHIDLRVERAIEHAPLAIKNELFKVAQELASNAIRHGRPGSVWVSLALRQKQALLEVRDDGVGFDTMSTAGAREGHFGLTGVQERVRWLGGAFEIVSAPGEGTTARVTLPLELSRAQ